MSDQSLREALECLIATHGGPDGYVMTSVLQKTLTTCPDAAHPAEPAMQVEVGDFRKTVADLVGHWDDTCDGVDWIAGTPEEYAEAAILWLVDYLGIDQEEVAQTEVPVPVADRERIAEVLSNATRDMDYKQWETPHGMLPFADALLAAGVFRSGAVALDREAVQAAVAEALEHKMVMDTPEGPCCDGSHPCSHEPVACCDSCADLGWPCAPVVAATDAVMSLARPEDVVKAEALREAADAQDADPEYRDPLRLKSDWLRERADEMEG